ncbi:MAG: hypothetical protein K6G37_02065 [Bacilli bacterium]|nr:hypothetical protein [Bacilli bacterium]
MKKYIHYCWFGGKPLPKLAKKCLESWKKYLPDWEIMRWDESNTDLNECPFVKGAYDNKKWAFVADYFRTKALKEYGGLYFDTDMIVSKDISHLFTNDTKTFLGVEDSGYVAVGVWYEKEKDAIIPNKLLELYQSYESFPINNLSDIAIPKIISNILTPLGLREGVNKIQKLEKGIYIYPREYFYPLSYNFQNNKFTDNTCMIHYYLATWVPKWERKAVKIYRKHGTEKGSKIIARRTRIKGLIKKGMKASLYPIYKSRQKKRNEIAFTNRLNEIISEIDNSENRERLVFCNKEWYGVKSATLELFPDAIQIFELYKADKYDEIAKHIASKKYKMVVFSGFAEGWFNLVKSIRKYDKKVRIKVIWHGSNAMHMLEYDWNRFKEMFELLDENLISSIAFVKKSMYEQYKQLGYNVEFLMNTVNIDKDEYKGVQKRNKKGINIGIYASGDRWVKNFYNQLSGASLIKNATVDVLPLSQRVIEVANLLKIDLTGVRSNIPLDEMRRRIAGNDIVFYTTFVECAPIIPLECLELGVLCITGNNHHYWEGTELEKYLVVSQVDNPVAIAKQAELCLKNKDKILKLYKDWKESYDKECKKNFEKFIK